MSNTRKPRDSRWTTVKVPVYISFSNLKRLYLKSTGNNEPTIAELRKVRMEDIQAMCRAWIEERSTQ